MVCFLSIWEEVTDRWDDDVAVEGREAGIRNCHESAIGDHGECAAKEDCLDGGDDGGDIAASVGRNWSSLLRGGARGLSFRRCRAELGGADNNWLALGEPHGQRRGSGPRGAKDEAHCKYVCNNQNQ